MSAIVTDEVLKEVKNFLDITWDDEAQEKKLSGIILRGMQRINELGGTEYDYSETTSDALAKDLLLNYVMYSRSNAIDEFMKNYAAEINELQIVQEVKSYAAKATQ